MKGQSYHITEQRLAANPDLARKLEAQVNDAIRKRLPPRDHWLKLRACLRAFELRRKERGR